MSILLQEETKLYTPKEIEAAIRKMVKFSGAEIVDRNTGFSMMVADNGEQTDMFVRDFFVELKSVAGNDPKVIRIRSGVCSIPECN